MKGRATRALLALSLYACGDDGGDASDAGAFDAVTPDASACPRAPVARTVHKVVVSHPYDAAGGPASTYRLLDLGGAGGLSDTGVTFEMGRSTIGEIAFTPDGEVAIVPQEDGTLGVVRFDGDTPVVVHAAFAGGFYADHVVVAPAGDLAYVLDNQWRENGGGIHRVAIGCDGTLTDLGRWVPSKLPAGLHLDGDRAVLVATDVGASPAGDDAHLLDWSAAEPGPLDGADAFGDDDAIVGGSAVTPAGDFLLIGDTSAFSGVPNRVAVVAIDGDTLTPVQVISPVEDPLSIVMSPSGDVALVVSGFGDAVLVLDHDPGAATPFTLRGEPTYLGASPQLPGHAVLLGATALLAELEGVRRFRFDGGGVVTDLGLTSLGNDTDAITGAIGVQP